MSDMDEHELCDMCGYRESDPNTWFADDGIFDDDPHTLDFGDGHIVLTYEGVCEYCEVTFSYTVYARVHTIEFDSDREVI